MRNLRARLLDKLIEDLSNYTNQLKSGIVTAPCTGNSMSAPGAFTDTSITHSNTYKNRWLAGLLIRAFAVLSAKQ